MAWTSKGVLALAESLEEAVSHASRLGLASSPGEREAAPPGLARALERGWAMPGEVELDMRGLPAFTRRVYRALLEVPPGSTTTYGELARRLGRPRAARAVGRALSANRLAPLVPCHRVVGREGPGGYSPGGLEKKLLLQALELQALGGGPERPGGSFPPWQKLPCP